MGYYIGEGPTEYSDETYPFIMGIRAKNVIRNSMSGVISKRYQIKDKLLQGWKCLCCIINKV